jgi:hypothetical protein
MSAMRQETTVIEYQRERWIHWPVAWSGVFVGALGALALGLLFGLIGIAIGTYKVGTSIVSWREFALGALVWSVLSAFLAYVGGGWAAATIGGFRRAEPAMLHGAIVWLVTVPFLLFFATLGVGGYLGSWYGGLAGSPAWVTPSTIVASPEAAAAARNAALGAVTALLLGLVGSAIGGWLASGQPMTMRSYRATTVK